LRLRDAASEKEPKSTKVGPFLQVAQSDARVYLNHCADQQVDCDHLHRSELVRPRHVMGLATDALPSVPRGRYGGVLTLHFSEQSTCGAAGDYSRAGKFWCVCASDIISNCRLAAEEEPIKLGVPFTTLGEQIDERMSRADLYKGPPRRRKRRGWKKEFLESLAEAAKNIGEVSEEEILRTLRSYRKERRAPEILPQKARKRKLANRFGCASWRGKIA
jgi:hypothetical protein